MIALRPIIWNLQSVPVKKLKNKIFFFTSRKYKFREKDGAYCISFATVAIDWKYSYTRNYDNTNQKFLEIYLN